MKYASLAVVLTLSIPVAAVEGPPTLNLMPAPAQLEFGEAAIEIGSEFSVTIEGNGATPRLRSGVQASGSRSSCHAPGFGRGPRHRTGRLRRPHSPPQCQRRPSWQRC